MEEEKKEKQKKDSPYSFPFQLDRYLLIDLIGTGGMGEVFLAEDRICHRRVALKRILAKSKGKEAARRRFKKEVHIAAQLSHPSIIPVYDLHDEGENLYYTMPYLEGKTLKEILNAARIATEKGHSPHAVGGSIPSLMLAFLNICQATEHTHNKGFIHRDLKPENIIVGKYNEVTILDWGVATEILKGDCAAKQGEEKGKGQRGKTNPCGVAGTIEYMAPERAFSQLASIQSDIYSLGVILYFMLTLEVPHKRPSSIKVWRKILSERGAESPVDPQDVAPYREITQHLSHITRRCLEPNTEKRYQSVREIITDLQRYIQGQPEWILAKQLSVHNAEDWEFQESVVLTKHMAISRYTGVMEWILLMLSKESYSGNIQLKATVKIEQNGGGIGFMMCVPSNSGREGLEKGYLVWIGSKENPGIRLLRDNVEVTRVDDIFLEPGNAYTIAVEKQDNTLRLFINDEPEFTHLNHVPIVGGHFGLVARDVEFEISPIKLCTGSQNVLVNCLSVPDAFLLNGDHARALMEYRRIAHSFKGRPEGREATFRAGFTLIEEGKKRGKNGHDYFSEALDEFELLYKTPGAPIEYLGKSLVYHAKNQLEEEIKCLELAVRKFPKHPLRHVLDDHILFRLHETAQKDRVGAYAFTLLSLRHVPRIYNAAETDRLTRNLTLSWEKLPFLKILPPSSIKQEEYFSLSILLSFWLARPGSLYELTQHIPEEFPHRWTLLENGLLALFELGYPKLIDFIIEVNYRDVSDPTYSSLKHLYEAATSDLPIADKADLIVKGGNDPLLYAVLAKELTLEKVAELLPILEKNQTFEKLYVWALLLAGESGQAETLFRNKPVKDATSIYFLLYGCYLAATEGEEAALTHFDVLFETPFPRSKNLLGHFLINNIDLEGHWFNQAFFWEKAELFKQLALYYFCLGDRKKSSYYQLMIQKEFSKYEIPLNFI